MLGICVHLIGLEAIKFFHKSRLIRGIHQKKIYKKIQRLDQELNPGYLLTSQEP